MKTGIGLIFALVLITAALAAPASAATSADNVVALTKPALAVGVAACLVSSETDGVERAARASEAVLLSVGLARTIKHVTGTGFPSGHTAGAFAMASSLSEVHPKQKWIYYTAATILACNSAKEDHTVLEVVAGAALGDRIGKMSMTSKNGLLLTKTIKF